MARPVDWTPLADSDPVPGRPADITAESNRLKQVADSIRDQVTALHKIATADQGGELVGQFAGKITSTANDLAQHLGKAEGRYRTVSGELAHWVTALDTAQSESYSQLQDAQQAQRDIHANTPAPPASAPPGVTSPPPSTPPASPQAIQQAHALADAQHRLDAARTALGKTLSALHSAAGTRSHNIKAAIKDDGLKDSWWDKFKHWMDDHSRLINDICNVLGWIATICAVVALFIPGLNIIAWIALGATVLALIGHTALAAAGDGSWANVALDVFALATFGVGKFAEGGMEAAEEGLQMTLKGAAAERAGSAAFKTADSARAAELSAAQKILKSPVASAAEKKAASALLRGSKVAKQANEALKADTIHGIKEMAEHGVEFEPLELHMPNLADVLHGSPTAAGIRAWGANVLKTLPGDADVVKDVGKLNASLNTFQRAFGAGASVDVFDKVFGNVTPYFNSDPFGYNGFKNNTTMPIGGSW